MYVWYNVLQLIELYYSDTLTVTLSDSVVPLGGVGGGLEIWVMYAALQNMQRHVFAQKRISFFFKVPWLPQYLCFYTW